MKTNQKDLFRLQHIIESIDKITQIVNSVSDFDVFLSRWIEQDAMIRNFEIIGEASHHISQQTKEKHSEIQWQLIKGMRNFIAHEYFGVDLDSIWNTAVNDIPKLKQQIEFIIRELEN